MQITKTLATIATLTLAACGGGGSDLSPMPDGTPIVTDGIEGYVTDHNGHNRARATLATDAADALILADFDASGTSEGYANLFADMALPGRMEIEVIAEMTGGKPSRILRITADQAAFAGIDQRQPLVPDSEGNYVHHFTGNAMVFVTLGDDPMRVGRVQTSGAEQAGVLHLQADIKSQTISIDFRTGINAALDSEIEVAFSANDIPFNIASGTYGGAIDVSVKSPTSEDIYAATGNLRGNIAASQRELEWYSENMTTSGVFTAEGNDVSVQGVLWGNHRNAPDPAN